MFVIFIERVLEHTWGGAVDGGPGGGRAKSRGHSCGKVSSDKRR